MNLFHRKRKGAPEEPTDDPAVANTELDRLLATGLRLDPEVDRTELAGLSGLRLVHAFAEASPDGFVIGLESIDEVDDYESILRGLATAAGRESELTGIACSYTDGDPTCTVRFTFAGRSYVDRPDWSGDYADGMFLTETAQTIEPPGKRAMAVIDEDLGLIVLYVPEQDDDWIYEFVTAQ